MQNFSLPIVLKLALEQHVAEADISHDEELEDVMQRLSDLNDKVQTIKEKAREKRLSRS
ncbi:hypothetical protein ACOI22_00280 [Glaciecola sp. 2405UD65-10]|jgi:hypothetical protein|uniref:hypothetical protein n=1 Tax=Glaciecola sp. 2405UD65-10 TaxID=3397244 RepID=UPI003B5B1E35